jgi:chemotaxis methyl-accepting protein methylase
VNIVSRRVYSRLQALGLSEQHHDTPLAAYDEVLSKYPGEWVELAAMGRIHFTRFNRDRCFDVILSELLPCRMVCAVQEGRPALSVWCAGCSTGEEPYSLALQWHVGGRDAAGADRPP